MATHVLESFITVRQAGHYAGFRQHWKIVDPVVVTPYALAKILVDGFVAPSAGTANISFLKELLSEDSFIKIIRARVVSPPNANNAVRFFQDSAQQGAFPGEVDALNVSGCIIWMTAGEAGLTGRNFMPGVSEDAYESGRATTEYQEAIDAYCDNCLDGITTTTGVFNLCIAHGVVPTYTNVSRGRLSASPGTQRRRRVPW